MYKNILEDKHISHKKSIKDSSVESFSIRSTNSIISSEIHRERYLSVDHEQKQQIIGSSWGENALDQDLWEDSKSPKVQIRSSEILFDNKENCGILSDKMIGLNSYFLTKSPQNDLYVFSKCLLKNKNLTDITMLQYHRYLQYIDISCNKIVCLSPLSSLSYLMHLNASHNQIIHVTNFTSPWYLTYVNLSYNHMTDIGDLKNCWSIVKLNLSHNVIENISGFENLKHLRYLDLSYNLIECIKNLDGLNIKELNLEGNCITSFKSATPGRGINTLSKLRTIILGYNRLSNLAFFKNAYSLRSIDLKFNKINDLLEVLNLKGSIFEVDFRGNSCTKWPNYRKVLISSIPSVKFIDGVKVFAAEKVKSITLFASPLDFTTVRKVAKLTLLEQLNISKIDAHVQPYDEISPLLIILTGPSALKKMALALHVARTISDKVKYCRWHTTKEMYEDDDERNAYILVSREQFNDMTRRGEFLVILDMLGHSYGFHTNQISSLISEKKIGLTQMNLHTTAEMSKRYSNVKAILMYTQSVDLHRDWIEEKFDVHTWIKDSVENLLVVKIGKHREDKEATNSISDFCKEILDKTLCRLQFPTYSTYVRPQDAITTDILLKNKMTLPEAAVQKSEVKRIERKTMGIEDQVTKLFDQPKGRRQNSKKDLKVLLDEEWNIIIEDEETKREMRRSKMLHRRRTLISTGTLTDFDDDLSDTMLSDETTETDEKEIIQEEKAIELKNAYVELVIQSRKFYLDYHESHPGFFSLVLLMDDYTEAFNTLINFIHESYASQSYRKSIFLSEIKYTKQRAISTMLENILNEMERENSSILKIREKKKQY